MSWITLAACDSACCAQPGSASRGSSASCSRISAHCRRLLTILAISLLMVLAFWGIAPSVDPGKLTSPRKAGGEGSPRPFRQRGKEGGEGAWLYFPSPADLTIATMPARIALGSFGHARITSDRSKGMGAPPTLPPQVPLQAVFTGDCEGFKSLLRLSTFLQPAPTLPENSVNPFTCRSSISRIFASVRFPSASSTVPTRGINTRSG